MLPNGEQVPDILVERYHGCEQCWRRLLAQVDDDLESRYLAAKRDQLEFVLSVPNHGKARAVAGRPNTAALCCVPEAWFHASCSWPAVYKAKTPYLMVSALLLLCCCCRCSVTAGKVEGVLWYFPYENDQETVPLDPHTMGRMLLTSHREGPTQPAGAGQGVLTQVAPSQLAAWQSQKGAGTQLKRQAELEPEQDAGGWCWHWQAHMCAHTYICLLVWDQRLI